MHESANSDFPDAKRKTTLNSMLLSMTGYGRVSKQLRSKIIVIEVKSLNSKFLDLKIRVPQGFRDKELEIRKMASERILRGKVDLSIDMKLADGGDEMVFHKDLFKAYYKEISETLQELNPGHTGDLTQAIMRIPNIVTASDELISDDEWIVVKDLLDQSIKKMEAFRKAEGDTIKEDFTLRVNNILELLYKIEPHEGPRISKLRERLINNLEELRLKEGVDANRFEQEVLFYIEKIDVTEEKQRLEQHCKYFLEQLADTKLIAKGRKLNFISQEMGREINTLGAKANSADIQRFVVQMKDELEKIKEQIANVL